MLTHGVAELIGIVLRLVARGYGVELRSCYRASYHAVIRDAMDIVVGDLEYRDPQDESNPQAQGLSYSSRVLDPQYTSDRVLRIIKGEL